MDQLDVEESMVTMDTNMMKDLEADSLDAVEIIMAIEPSFAINPSSRSFSLAMRRSSASCFFFSARSSAALSF